MAKADVQILIKAKDQASKELDKVNGSSKKMAKSLKIAAAAAAVAAVALTAKLAKDAVMASSNLNEAINAMQVTFGDAGDELLKFAETSARSAGLSKRAFLEATVPIGAMLQNVGISADEAASSSVTLAQRAADMASVFNVDVSEALTAINSGLRGESEPLKRFGIDLSEASIKAYAMKEGIGAASGELTRQEKVLARQGLLMEQSDKVAGDFTNTQDGLANKSRTWKATLENVAATIGDKLVPWIEKAMGWVESFILTIQKWWEENPEVQKTLEDIASTIGDSLMPMLEWLGNYIKEEVIPVIQENKDLFIAIAAVVGGLLVAALFLIVGAVIAIVVIFKTLLEWLGNAIDAIGNFVGDVIWWFMQIPVKVGEMVESIKQWWTDLLTKTGELVAGVVQWFVDMKDKIKNKATEMAAAVVLKFIELKDRAINKIARFVNMVKARFNLLKSRAKEIMRSLVDSVVGFFTGLPGRISSAISTLAEKISEAFSGAMGAAKDVVISAVNWIIDKVNGVISKANSISSKVGGPTFGEIPRLANGSVNFGGGLAVVGERGPELVNLPRGARVNSTPEMGTGNTTNIYGSINLGSSQAVDKFFDRIDRQQELARFGI